MPSSIRKTPISVELQRLDVESQARLDWLLDQNNEGRLTPAEREELQQATKRFIRSVVRTGVSLGKVQMN